MFRAYSRILTELHRDFFTMVNQSFAIDVEIPVNAISESGLRKIKNGEVTLIKEIREDGLALIRPNKVVYTSQSFGDFCIVYKSYSGLVASKAFEKYLTIADPKHPHYQYRNSLRKHGLFDFYFDAKSRYRALFGGDATHYNIFCDLFNHVTYEQCLDVAKGNEINHVNLNNNQSDVLVILSWLLFEQEVNYGSLTFQQFTNFSRKNNYRPRDMIMGFINMMYKDINLFNSYPYWNYKNGRKTTPTFGKPGYKELDIKYKKYFEDFEGHLDDYPSLFCNDLFRGMYIHIANNSGDNPAILAQG